ncbi:MAG TPA: flippase [Lacipirellulaceae bacterium]
MRFSAVTRISKNASMLLLGTMLRMVFTLAFVVYAARYLGVEGYGKFALTQSWFELCLSLTATGLGILVTREVAKDVSWLTRHLVPSIAMIVGLGAAAGGLLALVTHFASYAPDTRLAILIAALAIIPAALCAIAEAIFVAFEKAELVAVGTAAESLARTALWLAALMTGHGLLSLFVILIAARWVQLILYMLFLMRRLPPIQWRLELKTLWSLVLEWRVFAAETWLATLYLSLDVVLLSFFCGEAAVGLYDAAWKLIRFGPVVANSFTTAVFPFIARLYVNSREMFQQISEQSVKYILACVLPAVLCITILSDRIVVLLYSEQYASSAPILQVLAWLLIPQFLNPFLSRVLYARGQQGRSLAVSAIGLASFLAVALVLIPKFGVIGAAWSTVLSSYTALACYIVYCSAGTDRRSILSILLRQVAAATLLCVALHLMRDTQLVSVLAACAVLYAALLVGLRIVSTSDFKLLQELN